MAKVSSKIEEIEGKKYIVERREDGSIICKSLYDDPIITPEPEIDIDTLSDIEFKKLVLQKHGYKIYSAK